MRSQCSVESDGCLHCGECFTPLPSSPHFLNLSAFPQKDNDNGQVHLVWPASHTHVMVWISMTGSFLPAAASASRLFLNNQDQSHMPGCGERGCDPDAPNNSLSTSPEQWNVRGANCDFTRAAAVPRRWQLCFVWKSPPCCSTGSQVENQPAREGLGSSE